MKIVDVRKEFTKLGKKFNTNLQEFYCEYNGEGDIECVQSTWDVELNKIDEEFDNDCSILKLIMLCDEEVSTIKTEYDNVLACCIVYVGEEESEDHWDSFYSIRLKGNINKISVKLYVEKEDEEIIKNIAIEKLGEFRSWKELIDFVKES